MLLKLYEKNTELKKVMQVVRALQDGELVIYPTDTIYAIGCDAFNKKALEKLARVKGVSLKQANFSFLCNDLKHLSEYTKNISTHHFKILKKNIPGPFTFILEANNAIPKLFKNSKKTIGIRVPDNSILQIILQEFGVPIASTSIHSDDEILEYSTDPELIYEKYQNQVSVMVDGGYGNNIASTVVDLSQSSPEIIRQGDADLVV